MRRRLTLFLGGLVLVILILFGAGYYYLVRLPLPLTDGELEIKGLLAPVKIYRDGWGVPHIYATSQHDLFMAQGFVQAQDRLWQMETNRRLAAGRLSEVLGPDAIQIDRLMRTLGVMRAAQRELSTYDKSSLEILRAFSDGVNAFIESRRNRLPLEFRLLRVKPEPWQPEDSLAWAKVLALLGGKNWQEEIVRAMLTQKLGPEKAKTLLHYNRPGTPIIMPSSLDLDALWPLISSTHRLSLPALGGGSNNWAVHGSRTETGSPLLANDMHLVVGVPSVWYEMHLVGGDLDVIGLALAGVPGIIAGHNKEIAWGITFAYTDVQDVFLERMNPDKRGQYLYKGQWLQAELIEEVIKVKGQDTAVVHEVWKTRHGPIISPLVPEAGALGHALAFKWSAHEPGDMVPVLRRLNLARNWEDFKAAAQQWSEPAINLAYADRQGNIGYVLAGRIPIRSQGHGRGPFVGWRGEHEWLGYVPRDEKPFFVNPRSGFLATANNRVVGPRFPYYLGEDYSSGFRAARIEEVLSQKGEVSIADFKALQGDLKCIPAVKFLAALEKVEVQSPDARDLLDRLRAWDHVLSPDSEGGAIYTVLFYRLLENTFRDELGPLADRFFGIGLTLLEPLNRFIEHSRVILLSLMSDRKSPWFDDVRTPERETLAGILEKSLNETAAFLREKLGPDPSAWRWGRLHQVEFKHPLGQVRPLNRMFNIGPFEGGGHFATIWQSAVKPGMDFSLNGWTVSNRHVYDLNDWDNSVGAIVPGQSGMWGSPHYDDQVELWLNVDHHPLYYSRARVESEAKNILVLKP
ncbi:MAG: penicillin acylase family protein [Desulfobacteraceae bacterium]|nr:penicillin acylase family protein [Desulfobacteraceae bacterium]